MAEKLVFLGGTCGENVWRPGFIQRLISRGVPAVSLFDPVVEHWDQAAQENEERMKKSASHHLYYLATPSLTDGDQLSAYSMVEATMALYDYGGSTVVVFDHSGIKKNHLLKASKQAEKVLRARFPAAAIFGSSQEAEDWLVKQFAKSTVAA